MVKTYIVGPMIDGQFKLLGTAVFDERNVPSLTLDGAEPNHTALDSAWSDAVALDVLHFRRTEMFKNDKGHDVRGSFSVDVEKLSDEYPKALFEYLSVNGGYFGVEKK